MDEKSTWECGKLSRDNMSHPLVRHIAVKANMRIAHVMP